MTYGAGLKEERDGAEKHCPDTVELGRRVVEPVVQD
jgi:hypothetical protein